MGILGGCKLIVASSEIAGALEKQPMVAVWIAQPFLHLYRHVKTAPHVRTQDLTIAARLGFPVRGDAIAALFRPVDPTPRLHVACLRINPPAVDLVGVNTQGHRWVIPSGSDIQSHGRRKDSRPRWEIAKVKLNQWRVDATLAQPQDLSVVHVALWLVVRLPGI
jgi:hypothetical protein